MVMIDVFVTLLTVYDFGRKLKTWKHCKDCGWVRLHQSHVQQVNGGSASVLRSCQNNVLACPVRRYGHISSWRITSSDEQNSTYLIEEYTELGLAAFSSPPLLHVPLGCYWTFTGLVGSNSSGKDTSIPWHQSWWQDMTKWSLLHLVLYPVELIL
jgi:hypothetical protein